MTARSRAVSATAAEPPPTRGGMFDPVDSPEVPFDRNALRSPSRETPPWMRWIVRFAVYIAAAVAAEVLLVAYSRLAGIDDL